MARPLAFACNLTRAAIPLAFAAVAGGASTGVPPVAYRAEVIVVSKGETMRSLVFSDGVRRKTEAMNANGESSGTYADNEKKLSWLWGPGFGCLQMPLDRAGVTSREEPAGSETIDGHPTKKVKVRRRTRSPARPRRTSGSNGARPISTIS